MSEFDELNLAEECFGGLMPVRGKGVYGTRLTRDHINNAFMLFYDRIPTSSASDIASLSAVHQFVPPPPAAGDSDGDSDGEGKGREGGRAKRRKPNEPAEVTELAPGAVRLPRSIAAEIDAIARASNLHQHLFSSELPEFLLQLSDLAKRFGTLCGEDGTPLHTNLVTVFAELCVSYLCNVDLRRSSVEFKTRGIAVLGAIVEASTGGARLRACACVCVDAVCGMSDGVLVSLAVSVFYKCIVHLINLGYVSAHRLQYRPRLLSPSRTRVWQCSPPRAASTCGCGCCTPAPQGRRACCTC